MKVAKWLITVLVTVSIVGCIFTGANRHGKAQMLDAMPIVPEGYESAVDAFIQLQKAFKSKNPNLIYDLSIASSVTREESLIRWKNLTRDQRIWEDYMFKIISDGTIIRIEPLENGICKVWLRLEEDRRLGYQYFGKEGDQWRWLGLVWDDKVIKTYPFYDSRTPTKAFQSLKQSVDLDDPLGVYNSITGKLRAQISFEDYDRVVKEREKSRKGVFPSFSYDADHLEEEMLEPKSRKPHCKVWKLDDEGKRIDFELFIKEGKEWKWLPDPKYIWYPAKEDKE